MLLNKSRILSLVITASHQESESEKIKQIQIGKERQE